MNIRKTLTDSIPAKHPPIVWMSIGNVKSRAETAAMVRIIAAIGVTITISRSGIHALKGL
jgi:hypothetical protein